MVKGSGELMQESIIKDKQNDGNSPDLSSKTKSASFIFGVTTLATFTGFAFTLTRAKRSYTTKLNTLHTDGSKLALKALGYGTAISVTGCSSLVLLVALALGVRSPKEFGEKMKGTLKIKRKTIKET